MKTLFFHSVFVVIILIATSISRAEMFIVGGSLLNGDFNGTGLALPPTGAEDFDTTPSWTNFGTGGGTQNATNTDQNADQGFRNAVIFDQPTRVHGLETGYTIQAGDVFNTNYVWQPSTSWDQATDQIGVTLFTTSDNTINGTRTNLTTNLSGPSFTPIAPSLQLQYQTVLRNSFYTAQPSDVGRQLFVEVDGIDGNGSDGFARLDNFELSVGPIGPAAPFLEFNPALNPTNGTNIWQPNIDTFGPFVDSNPLEFFTFGSAASASPVNDPTVPGITASYSAGGQGRNFFDGTTNQGFPNYATLGPGFQLNGEAPVSFEVWFKPNSLTGGDQILAEFGGSGNGTYLSLQDGTLSFHTRSGFAFSGDITLTAPALTSAEWTQVVGTWDGGAGEYELFVNGQSVDSSSGTPLQVWAGGNAFGIGQRAQSDSDPGNDIAIDGPLTETASTDFVFDGEIGLFRIYNRRLDAARVTAAFDAIAASSLPGDFDGDGDVDGNDFLEWQRTDGTASGLEDWRNNFPTSSLAAVGAAVPEPSSLAIASCLALFGGLSLRTREVN